MALIPLNAGREPLGQFDSIDAQNSNWKGGEVATWYAVTYVPTGTDKAAADVIQDGYNPGPVLAQRTAVGIATGPGQAPLFLTDDGIAHYGTLFGTVVGRTTGQSAYGPNSVVSSGDLLGPNTTAGSGKITLWDKPGLYGVTLDAVDTTASIGLVPSNSSATVGAALSYTANGLLTVKATNGTGTSTVGYLSEFQTNGSLVTTPQTLVAALNSPSGDVSSLQQESLYMAVFWFVGA